jgi:hypothetical protein
MARKSWTTTISLIILLSARKKGKREYLNDVETKEIAARLNAYFEEFVEIPRIKVGKRQTIETLINEEALLFARNLRKELRCWKPKTVSS